MKKVKKNIENIRFIVKNRHLLASMLRNKKAIDLETTTNNQHFYGNNQFFDFVIGKNSYVSFNSIIYHCEIGNYCSIGPNVVIGFGNHPTNHLSTSPHIYYNERFFESQEIEMNKQNDFQKVELGHDVWVGANVFIKNGVKIGNGAVIAAGAIVLSDVRPYEVVGGVPAKLLKKRFSDELIQLLDDLKWWELSENELEEIKEIIHEPTIENVSMYLNKKLL